MIPQMPSPSATAGLLAAGTFLGALQARIYRDELNLENGYMVPGVSNHFAWTSIVTMGCLIWASSPAGLIEWKSRERTILALILAVSYIVPPPRWFRLPLRET